MSYQFSHSGDEWSGTHSLLFILRPTEPIARHERRIHGLTGMPIDPERLHITLFCLGQYDGGLPPEIVTRAMEAAGMIAVTPFEVTLDRLLSFRHPSGERPLVLRGSDDIPSLRAFHQDLAMALAKASLKRFVKSRITPHVTLLRDSRGIPERPIRPISWTVRDFVLVDSLIGKSRHIQLGKWTLH
jgi:2'-5' RNA ligase